MRGPQTHALHARDLTRPVGTHYLESAEEAIGLFDDPHFVRLKGAMSARLKLAFERVVVGVVRDADQTSTRGAVADIRFPSREIGGPGITPVPPFARQTST
jgi:hypothetical protein